MGGAEKNLWLCLIYHSPSSSLNCITNAPNRKTESIFTPQTPLNLFYDIKVKLSIFGSAYDLHVEETSWVQLHGSREL